ncbi:MAG: SBBP repeat-containing protein [Armatimonadetes bacterium]|nr:SBBP repeat-containing protein [Armatimonadota bacterium]
MRAFFLVFFAAALVSVGFAQFRPVWTSNKHIKGDGPDRGDGIAVAPNGEVFVAGTCDPDGNPETFDADVLLVKYDREGEQVFASQFSLTPISDDQTTSISLTPQGDIYVAGYTDDEYNHDSGEYNFLLLKFGQDGDLIWSRTYNGVGLAGNYAMSVLAQEDGGAVVTGYSPNWNGDTDAVTLRYSATGSLAWERRFAGSGSGNDFGWKIARDGNGNLYILGDAVNAGTGRDIVVIKYTSAGSLVYSTSYNGPDNGADHAGDFEVDLSGRVKATGSSFAGLAMQDIATLALGQNGTIEWSRRWNGVTSNSDYGWSVVTDSAGNVYVAGTTTVNAFNLDGVLLKYSPSGTLLWNRQMGGSGVDGLIVALLGDLDTVFVVGYASAVNGYLDFAIALYDSSGSIISSQATDGGGNYDDAPLAATIDLNNNVFAAGYTTHPVWGQDMMTVRYQQKPFADLNEDYCVDDTDLSRVLTRFGATSNGPEDINRDGVVDDIDLAIVLTTFGMGCN